MNTHNTPGQLAPSVPDGFVLAPKYPTPSMIAAMRMARGNLQHPNIDAAKYRAAISAAPMLLDQPLSSLRNLIADDAHAMSFQSLGQYRSALLTADLKPPVRIDLSKPVAWVPIHPHSGPLWANVVTTMEQDRPSYPLMPLYAATRPAGQDCALIEAANRTINDALSTSSATAEIRQTAHSAMKPAPTGETK